MKQHGAFVIKTNKKPVILMSYKTIEMIKYLVGKFDKECQWFHRVNKIVREDTDTVIYHLYDIFIPEQECAFATVESDPNLMINLYKEMEDRSQSTEEFNEICINTSCWCHSHVRMGTGPSGTDDTQFREQVSLARDGGQSGPQIMLIFNKSNEYFSRVWDPDLRLLFEEVPIIIQYEEVDFSYVKEAIDNKLKNKTYNNNAYHHHNRTYDHHRKAGLVNSSAETDTDWPNRYPHQNSSLSEADKKKDKITKKTKASDETRLQGTDDKTVMPLNEIRKAYKLINEINSESNCHKAISQLIECLDQYLEDNEYFLLESLLFGTRQDIEDLKDITGSAVFQESVSFGKEVFAASLEGDTIDPPWLLYQAIKLVKEIPKLENEKLIKALKYWNLRRDNLSMVGTSS